MKTLRPVRFAVVLLGAPVAMLSAPDKGPLVALRSTHETITEPLFGCGTPASEVLLAVGEPDTRLACGVWVYSNYHTNRADLNARGFDTLVIAFSDDRVVGLKIVAHQTLEPLIARLPAVDATRAFAAK